VATRRTYGDLCGIARALDAVGERWALLVVRELLLGPKRFTDLRAGLPNVGPDILSERLRELERADLVRRRKLAPPAAARVYELTERGMELEPVVIALGRWGSAAPVPHGEARIGVDSTILGMKTLFDAAADGISATFELHLDDQWFHASIVDGRFEVQRGEDPDADATIEADPMSLTALLWQGRPLADAERAGEVTIEGSRRAAKHLLRAFPIHGP
jgi:DNA-binding HxlR family transcriptional regulator